MKYKAFLIIFKGPSVNQITQFFLEGESPTLNSGRILHIALLGPVYIHNIYAYITQYLSPCQNKIFKVKI